MQSAPTPPIIVPRRLIQILAAQVLGNSVMVGSFVCMEPILGVHGTPESANGTMVVDVYPGQQRMPVVLTGGVQHPILPLLTLLAFRCKWEGGSCIWNRDAQNNVCLHAPASHATLPDATRNCADILKGRCPLSWEVLASWKILNWSSLITSIGAYWMLLGGAQQV